MRSFVRREGRPAGLDGDEGMTLVEVIVALGLFTLVAAGIAAMVITGIGTSREARNRTLAADVAGEHLENARGIAVSSFGSLVSPSTTVTTSTVDGIPFTVTRTAAFTPKNAPIGACAATTQGGSTAVQPILLVTESVTWPRMGRARPVTSSTTFKPPIGSYAAASGGIDIMVADHESKPVGNIPVTVTKGGSTSTVTTNSAGCAFAAFLTPGAYTVTVSVPGYVDGQEATASTQTVNVLSGQVATASFLYDRAAQVQVTFAASGPPPATGLSATVGNSALAPTGTFSSPVGVTQFGALYPYPSYRIWAGRCPEANPEAVTATNTPLYAGTPVTSVTPVADQVTAVAVPLYALEVTVKDSTTLAPVDGAVLTATEQAGQAMTACSAPFSSYGLSPSQTVTGRPGVSQTGLPLGTFTIVVSYASRTATATVTMAPAGFATEIMV